MAELRDDVKSAASEETVGKLHKLVTTAFIEKTQRMVDLVEEGEDALDIINTMDLNAAARWVQANDIGALARDKNEQSELKSNLERIRERQRVKLVSVKEA